MNVHDADPLPPEPEAPGGTPGTDPAVKPKRKRAPRKVAAVADAGEASASPLADLPQREGSALAADSPSVDERTPSAPVATGVAAAVPVAATVGAIDIAGDSDVARRDASDDAVGQPAGAEGGDQGEDQGERGAGQAGETAAAGTGEDADRPRSARRSRNRRRGRRNADKRAADGSAVTDGEPDAEAEPGAAGAAGEVSAPQREPRDRKPEVAAPVAVPAAAGEVFAEVLSGLFDAEPAVEAELDAAVAEPQAAPKRVLAAEPDAPKLHKVLAQSGAGSRRDLEQMIIDNRVTVNGEVAHTGQRISFGDRIAIDGKPVRVRIAPPPPRVLAYHKPAGEVVTHDDPQQRPTVFRRLPRLQQGKWQSVGRLDINTEGLLLFTNSGELANQLMHPRFGVEREYAVRSLGTLGPDAKVRLLAGVDIDGQACAFKSIDDGGGEGVNHWYRCVITEGRNREVRKLFEAVGHAVSRLIRIRYGSVVLPRGLKRGVWVDLGDGDLRDLRRLAGSVPRPERDGEREEAAEPRGRNARKRRGGKRRRDGEAAMPALAAPEAGIERLPRDDGPPRAERPPRVARPPRSERPPREDRPPRGPRPEPGEGGPIPNPLQQTFDKRAIQQERALRREMPEDGPIPNPLQQTYDKRALMRDRAPQRDIPEDGPIPNPLQQTYDKRFAAGGGGGGKAGRGGNASGGGNAARGGFGGGQGGGQGGNRAGAAGRGKARGGNAPKKGGAGAPREPDPLQTSVGFIGGDAFLRKGGGRGGPRSGGRGPGGGAGGGQRSGGGGGGGGGGKGGRGR